MPFLLEALNCLVLHPPGAEQTLGVAEHVTKPWPNTLSRDLVLHTAV
jgi:hypothetical protein